MTKHTDSIVSKFVKAQVLLLVVHTCDVLGSGAKGNSSSNQSADKERVAAKQTIMEKQVSFYLRIGL